MALQSDNAAVAQAFPIRYRMLPGPGAKQSQILSGQSHLIRLGHIQLDSGDFTAHESAWLHGAALEVDHGFALTVYGFRPMLPYAEAEVAAIAIDLAH